MKYSVENNIPILKIDNYKIIGWNLLEMPHKYINQNAVVFSNDCDVDDDLETQLYELIKNFSKEDFPDSRIEFIIDHVHVDILSKPLDRLPYPFYGITIGLNEDKFLVRFSTIHEKGTTDDEWNKKWTTEFYFDSLSRITKSSTDLSIKYEKDDDFISISIECLSSAKTIELAIDEGLTKIEHLLEKVEHSINGLEGFFDVIEIWNKNKSQKNEKFWQSTFKKYSWILSVAINEPTMLFEDEAFIGGKNLSNTKGNIIDFLFKNKLSDNVALIEIKTPLTKIIGSKYRNTFTISPEFTGAINQLLHYKETIQKEFFGLAHKTIENFSLSSPNCYLIIGSIDKLNKCEKECFESFRRNFSGIEILTFDEIFEKLFFVLSLIKRKTE